MLKIMIFTFIIFQFMQEIYLKDIPGTSQSNNQSLYTQVKQFYINFVSISEINENDSIKTTNILSDLKNDENKDILKKRDISMFLLLRNLRYILSCLKKYKKNTIENKMRLQNNDEQKHQIYITDYELFICHYSQRHLDLIYFSAIDLDLTIVLQKAYYNLCTSWIKVIVNTKVINQKLRHYKYNNDHITVLLGLFNTGSFDELYNMNAIDDLTYQNHIKYVENIYNIVNHVDLSQYIASSDLHKNKLIITDIQRNTQGDITESISVSSRLADSDTDSFQSLTIKPPEYIIDDPIHIQIRIMMSYAYIQCINNMQKKCIPILLPSGLGDEIIQWTYALVEYSLKRYIAHYKINTFKDYNTELIETADNTYVNYEGIINHLQKIHVPLCNHVAIIINYIKRYNLNDTILTNLYLLLCSDNMDFYEYRCPTETLGKFRSLLSYHMPCIVQSFNNKFLMNDYFSITNKSDKNKIIDDYSCTQPMFEYFERISTAITKNNGISTPVWNTSEWMTGKYFLTGISLLRLNKNKHHTMRVGLVDMKLEGFYHFLLQWNLNKNVVTVFHKNIMYYVDCMFKMFFYKQLKLIVLYINRIYKNFKDTVFDFLLKIFEWYIQGEKIFNKYLGLSGVYKTSQITKAMEMAINKKSKDDLSLIIQNGMPTFLNKHLNEWSVEKKVCMDEASIVKHYTNLETYIKYLQTCIVGNCFAGVEAINNFISIVTTSIVFVEPDKELVYRDKEDICSIINTDYFAKHTIY